MSAPPPRAPCVRLEAGKLIGGKYRLAWRLGSGGMGEVWRATNEATGAPVAIKVMGASDDEVRAERFRNEARLGSTLSHRGIVRIFDLIEEPDGTLALVMELLRGESVAEWRERKGLLSTTEAVAIALPVLSALAHAHASGVVHRDLKPANIFLAVDPDGTVVPKLVDFGIAKVPASPRALTMEGSVLGTPKYMAPEQIRGATDIDGRSDLFSLAATLYDMIAGASPFEAATPAASLAAVLESPVDPDPRIDPGVCLELQRALSKRPYERHANADELAAALRAATGETDASLAALLKRDPPPATRLDEAPPSSGPSVSGHQLDVRGGPGATSDRARRRGPPGRALWIVGAVFALCGLVLAEAVARRPAEPPKAAASPLAAAASAAEATPPPAVIEAEPDVVPVAASAPVPRARPRPSSSVTPPRRTAPVATTPGF